MKRRLLAAGALATFLVLALSGCENVGLSPDVYLTLSDQSVLTMKVCPDISVRKIVVEERQQIEQIDWHAVWVESGTHSIGGGTNLQIPSSIAGMVTEVSTAVRHDKHTEVNIVLVGADGHESTTAGFDLRAKAATKSSWLGTNGQTTKAPCAAAEQ